MMNIALLNSNSTNPIIVLLIILGLAGVIALAAFVVYRLLHPKLKKEDETDENKILQEELDRVLQPVEDEELKKQIEDYNESDE